MLTKQTIHDASIEYDKDKIYNRYLDSPWYEKIVYFLLYLQCPPYLNKNEYRWLKLKDLKYVLIYQVLYWKDLGCIFLKRLDKSEFEVVTAELHGGACGGHKYWKETTFNILRDGYYWSTLFTYLYL